MEAGPLSRSPAPPAPGYPLRPSHRSANRSAGPLSPIDLRLGAPGAGEVIAAVEDACRTLGIPVARAAFICEIESARNLAGIPRLEPAAEGPEEEPATAAVRLDPFDPGQARQLGGAASRVPELHAFLDLAPRMGAVHQSLSGGNWSEAMTPIALGKLRACLARESARGLFLLCCLFDRRLLDAMRLLLRCAGEQRNGASR
jgi:hypothetical protein